MKRYYGIPAMLFLALVFLVGCGEITAPEQKTESASGKPGRGLDDQVSYACRAEVVVMAEAREDLAALEKDYEEVGIEMIEFPNPTVPEEGTDIHFDATGTNFVPMTIDDVLKGYSGNDCGFVYDVKVLWDWAEEEYLIDIEVRCDTKTKANDLLDLYTANGWTTL